MKRHISWDQPQEKNANIFTVTGKNGDYHRLEMQDEGPEFVERYSLRYNGKIVWYGMTSEEAAAEWASWMQYLKSFVIV